MERWSVNAIVNPHARIQWNCFVCPKIVLKIDVLCVNLAGDRSLFKFVDVHIIKSDTQFLFA